MEKKTECTAFSVGNFATSEFCGEPCRTGNAPLSCAAKTRASFYLGLVLYSRGFRTPCSAERNARLFLLFSPYSLRSTPHELILESGSLSSPTSFLVGPNSLLFSSDDSLIFFWRLMTEDTQWRSNDRIEDSLHWIRKPLCEYMTAQKLRSKRDSSKTSLLLDLT